MRRKAIVALGIVAWCGWAGQAMSAPITGGDLVISQIGLDGSGTALSNAAASVVLKEFTTSGALVQQIGMPTSASGGNYTFSNSGSATSEGELSLSANGKYLTLAGYDAAAGTAGVATAANIGRVIGRVDLNGTISTGTRFTDSHITNNIRGVTSDDGTQFWTSGTGSSSSGGTRYLSPLGATTSTQVSTTVTNTRVVNIYKGQLYTSSQSGANVGINLVGSGLPTNTGNSTTLLAGFSTVTGLSPYDFWFANDNTLYVADDGALTGASARGGLQKWTFDGTNWNLSYRITGGLTAGLRGLAGTVDGLGNAVLYAITADATANKLVNVTDTGSSSTFSTLATAGTNTIFRGVELVPEPATFGFLAMGGLLLPRRRRR